MDRKVKTTTEKKLGLSFDNDLSSFMLKAPFRQGGLGFTSLKELRVPAFLASAYLTLKASKKGTVLRTLPRHKLERLPTMLKVESELRTLSPEQLRAVNWPSPCSLTTFVSRAKRDKDKQPELQSKLQGVLAETEWSTCMKRAPWSKRRISTPG